MQKNAKNKCNTIPMKLQSRAQPYFNHKTFDNKNRMPNCHKNKNKPIKYFPTRCKTVRYKTQQNKISSRHFQTRRVQYFRIQNNTMIQSNKNHCKRTTHPVRTVHTPRNIHTHTQHTHTHTIHTLHTTLTTLTIRTNTIHTRRANKYLLVPCVAPPYVPPHIPFKPAKSQIHIRT